MMLEVGLLYHQGMVFLSILPQSHCWLCSTSCQYYHNLNGENLRKKFIDDAILLLYERYVDDLLVVIKKEHLQFVHSVLHNSDMNLNFTVDNVVIHFLDIEIHLKGWNIDCKDTSTRQYTCYRRYSTCIC